MRLCPKCQKPFTETLTKQNVVIDACGECRGVWLDEGEINFLAGERQKLFPFYAQGLKDAEEAMWNCPRCRPARLFTGKMPEFGFQAETCPRCKGIFLDELELNLITRTGLRPAISASKIPAYLAAQSAISTLPTLPSLGLASAGVLAVIYALLFGILVGLARLGQLQDFAVAPIMLAMILLQFLVGPWLMDISLRWLGSLRWVEPGELPPHLAAFLRNTCAEKELPLPRVGIIEDDAPNAFTYGRSPRSARLVLTRGLLNNLGEEELRAVAGHELGHIAHWDFLVMTVAQLVPVLLYELYRLCRRIANSKRSSGGRHDPRGAFLLMAVAAYLAYVISHYTVMYLSRVREYWADRFGAETVKNPNHLASALVKIGYGLAYGANRQERYGSAAALGIFDPKAAAALALYAHEPGGKTASGTGQAKEAMQWDLWNPWASFYEIHSTHPLIAKRINALGVQARSLGIEPAIVFDLRQPESYWDDFLADLFILLLPAMGILAGIALGWRHHGRVGYALLGLGAALLVRLAYSYPGEDGSRYSVAALLKKIKVSGVRGIPVKVQGTVIGRGSPGSALSEDFFLRDKTGIIYLDYDQPLALANFLFGVFRRRKYEGAEVEVLGWYRRAPVPYIEIARISAVDGSGTSSVCHTRIAKQAGAALIVAAGVACILSKF